MALNQVQKNWILQNLAGQTVTSWEAYSALMRSNVRSPGATPKNVGTFLVSICRVNKTRKPYKYTVPPREPGKLLHVHWAEPPDPPDPEE